MTPLGCSWASAGDRADRDVLDLHRLFEQTVEEETRERRTKAEDNPRRQTITPLLDPSQERRRRQRRMIRLLPVPERHGDRLRRHSDQEQRNTVTGLL
jgi:hypothetical protein